MQAKKCILIIIQNALLGFYLSGDPRRLARPVEFVTASSEPCISIALNDDQISQCFPDGFKA